MFLSSNLRKNASDVEKRNLFATGSDKLNIVNVDVVHSLLTILCKFVKKLMNLIEKIYSTKIIKNLVNKNKSRMLSGNLG